MISKIQCHTPILPKENTRHGPTKIGSSAYHHTTPCHSRTSMAECCVPYGDEHNYYVPE